VAEHKIVSMQESTAGAVAQFLDQEECECLKSIKLISYLCGALQRYVEEGVVLNPKVLLCDSIDKFSKALPGGRYIIVDQGDYSADSGKQILKQCATLARAGWVIFVERNQAGTSIKFGVLSFLASPTSVDLKDMVALGLDASLGAPEFAALVEKIDPKTVLVTGSKGSTLKIAFSTTRAVEGDVSALSQFSKACTSATAVEGFPEYLGLFLPKALNESHGSILVCRTAGPITKVRGMKDAVVLTPPLDLGSAFADYKNTNSAESILELQRSEALAIGMFQSDGIVVFDDEGKITAYRVFFREVASSKSVGEQKKPKVAPVGGARRRAYEGLKQLVGTELNSVLFRSQDGLTEVEGA
jgi:hypothetical protein